MNETSPKIQQSSTFGCFADKHTRLHRTMEGSPSTFEAERPIRVIEEHEFKADPRLNPPKRNGFRTKKKPTNKERKLIEQLIVLEAMFS